MWCLSCGVIYKKKVLLVSGKQNRNITIKGHVPNWADLHIPLDFQVKWRLYEIWLEISI
jgi:hypothetical protein